MKKIGKIYIWGLAISLIALFLIVITYKFLPVLKEKIKPSLIVREGIEKEKSSFKELGSEYDDLFGIFNWNNELAYLALKDGQKYLIKGNNAPIKLENQYSNTASVINQDGKLLYLINTGKSYFIISEQGERITKEYKKISNVDIFDHKLIFLANDGEKEFVVYDGEELGKNYSRYRYFIKDGLLYFLATIKNDNFLIYDNQIISKNYHNSCCLTRTDEGLVFLAPENNRKFIVLNNQPYNTPEDNIWAVKSINGKLAYIGEKNHQFYIIYDGQKITPDQKEILFFGPVIENKISYVAKNGDKQSFWVNDQQISDSYDEIFYSPEPQIINNKLTFMARKGDKIVIVNGKNEIGSQYDKILIFKNINDKLVYLAIKNGKKIIVAEY